MRLVHSPLIALTFVQAFAAPPPNDDRAAAEVLSSTASANANGTLTEATHEVGEPDLSPFSDFADEPTVWYRWTAPAGSEWLRVELSGINTPSVLAVYPSGSDWNLELSRSRDPNAVYLPVTAGSTYEIRASVWPEDLFSLPYPQEPDLDFALNLKAIGAPVTAEDHILRARGRFAARSRTGTTGALADLSSALAIDPGNPEALFLRGLVRLIALETEPAFDQLLTDLGISATGSLLDGTLDIPEDAQGRPTFAAGADSGDVVAWVTDHFLPRLAQVRADFGAITDDGFLTQLSGAETGADSVTIDRGDVLALVAMTHGLEMLFNLIFTYDLSVSLESIMDLERNGQLDAEQTMATFQNLLDFAATDRRAQFAAELVAMRDSYAAASDLILARGEQSGHLTGDLGGDPSADSELRHHLDLGVGSLAGEVNWDGTRVDLSRLMTTGQSLRDWLPALSGNDGVPASWPDPTFGGTMPGGRAREAESIFHGLGRLAGMTEYSASVGGFLEASGYPSGPFDDADADGLSNFDEFVFLTDPTVPDVVFQTLEKQEVGSGQRELTFTFIRPTDSNAGNWPLVVAVSDDLATWDRTEAKVRVHEVVDNLDGLTETVTYQVTGVDPAQADNRYFRIEAVYRENP